MIAWKQSLPEYEWLIHQVWYLEVPEGEVIDPKPHLIPNPRAHLLFTPPEQGYSYDTGDTKLAGKGCHLLTANEHLLLLEDTAPIKRIGITFRPEGLYAMSHGLLRHPKLQQLTNANGLIGSTRPLMSAFNKGYGS
ncbi:hypothetical protein NB483_03480 [Vibrio alginolyticus]|nr:hypothetical protein [Vibrio alginolyticus]MCR9439227.1 hypothetical protein [Vibrio alginolyticus]MCR9536190.1 hypothetical protein [Vibrio alginolyticus]MCR9563659.1 hypothetical protein [Vibrio alginolyticus]MCS0104083.1 hypothetical protein [Vibrio alginolyticus]MCS0150944.1 hypothetical protein [Vibrio alginolyticus]